MTRREPDAARVARPVRRAGRRNPPAERLAEALRPDPYTYLKTLVAGRFLYLYLFVDIWSRKIVGWSVHEEECGEHASATFSAALGAEQISGKDIVLHQDNGAPMKGATLKATLERLGVIASYSRPRVTDDNPYSEALFRTVTGPNTRATGSRAWPMHGSG